MFTVCLHKLCEAMNYDNRVLITESYQSFEVFYLYKRMQNKYTNVQEATSETTVATTVRVSITNLPDVLHVTSDNCSVHHMGIHMYTKCTLNVE